MLPEALVSKIRDSEANFVVTGGGGWLGQASLNLLARVLGERFRDRVRVFGSRERELSFGTWSIPCRAMDALSSLERRPTLFLHYAFLTKDRVSQMTAEEFARINGRIAEGVTEAVRRMPAAGIFVPSSGAVYRRDRSLEEDFNANPYGAMKVADERRFLELAGERKCRLVIARVFNLAGPFINKIGSYALGSIINDVLHGTAITLNASHPVIRSYLHIEDLIALALSSLLDARAANEPPFDTAGEIEVEIEELAARAARLFDKPGIAIVRPPVLSEPVDRYVGEPGALRELARLHDISPAPLDRQILDTANYLGKLG